MFDLMLYPSQSDDDRIYYEGFELIIPKNDEKELSAIDKRFKASKKKLQELFTEADSFSRDLKRRISDVRSSTSYGRNQSDTEMRLYEAYQSSIKHKLDVQKEIINVDVKCVDLQLKLEKNNIDSGKPAIEQMSNKVLGMSLLNGASHQAVGFNQFNGLINPNNTKPQMAIENVGEVVTGNTQVQQPQGDNNQNFNVALTEGGDETFVPGSLLVDKTRNSDYNYALKNLELRNKVGAGECIIKDVLHYDRSNGLFWVDTIDENTGAPIDGRKKHIAMLKDCLDIDLKNMSARDEYGGKYAVVLDTAENMPEEVKGQWREFSDKIE